MGSDEFNPASDPGSPESRGPECCRTLPPGLNSLPGPVGAVTKVAASMMWQVDTLVEDLHSRREAFRGRLGLATALNAAQAGELRCLDVGGARFHTHDEVLHCRSGMLSVMMSDAFPGGHSDEGWLFLDRDPQWFPLVLHFLRTGTAWVPDDEAGRQGVFHEARYYGLEGLLRAAGPRRAQVVVVGERRQDWHLPCGFMAEMYDPARRSWGRLECPRVHADCPLAMYFVAGAGSVVVVTHADPECDDFQIVEFCPSTGERCRWHWDPTTDEFRGSGRYGHNGLPFEDWCTTFHDGQLYTLIGYGDWREVQALSMATGRWRSLPPLLVPRRGAAACMVGGQLLVVGGWQESDDTWWQSGEEYVAAEERWKYLPEMPRPVSYATAVAWEGQLLVIGGIHDNSGWPSCAVAAYDPVSRKWRDLPGMTNPRYLCAAVVVDGDVLVMGGQNGKTVDERTVERYSAQSHRWEAMPDMVQDCTRLAAVLVSC